MAAMCSPPALDVEDQSLAQAVGACDPTALAFVFRTYSARMKRIALGVTGSVAEADDVVQEVFLRLPEAIASFEGRCALWGWLRRVTVLRARMAVRAQARRREARLTADHPTSAQADGILDWIGLDRAIAALPARQRAVLLLRAVEGFTHEEIGRALGTSANVSCVTLSRARTSLRRAMEGTGSSTLR